MSVRSSGQPLAARLPESALFTKELFTAGGMTKRYGNVTVLTDVDFDLRPGEIHALLGANGAGKSTLCKMISGLTDVTSGTMTLQGQPFAPANKQVAERGGIQIVQQELNLIPTLSVAENLYLAGLPSIAGVVLRRQLHQRARDALDRLQLHSVQTDTPVGKLGVGRRQMVEIAAALAHECKVLILDEPTAALSGSESEILFEQLQGLRARGVGMIYISHRLDEVKRIADRLTVLRDGRKVGTVDAENVSTDDMVQMMVGEATAAPANSQLDDVSDAESPVGSAAPVLVVNALSCGIVREVSFEVRAGEKLGITGLVGAGRTELLRAIFGADKAESGSVSVRGRVPQRFSHPCQAVEAGLAMVTEDRKQNGLLLSRTIRDNVTLSSMTRQFSNFGIVDHGAEESAVGSIGRSLEIRCTGIEQLVGQLSGGNQQKVAIAKWLTREADVFLFDEPTRGIDVGARRRIYQLLDELSAVGKGIVTVSSDLDELFETCDRIAVMSAGRLVKIFQRGSWSEDEILQASFAGHRGGRNDSVKST